MRPLGGLNTDASPRSQPPDTYRRAYNWVYGAELDALMQEPIEWPGGLWAGGTEYRVLAAKFLEDDLLVTLSIPFGEEELWYDSGPIEGNIALHQFYSADSAAVDVTFIYQEVELGFWRHLAINLVSFKNNKGEYCIIWSDKNTKPKFLNLSKAPSDANIKLLNLFPDYRAPRLNFVEFSAGNLAPGAYFVGTRYLTEDGRYTPIVNLTGPQHVKPNTRFGLKYSISGIDTAYKYIEVVLAEVVNSTITVSVVKKLSVDSSSIIVALDSSSTIEELLLEDITVPATVYTRMNAIELHENRLYAANLEVAEEVNLQQYANNIVPYWEVESNVNYSDSTQQDASFMPGEVYALYVAWVRDDGTTTEAYHIPGRAIEGVEYYHELYDDEYLAAPSYTLANNASIPMDAPINDWIENTDIGDPNNNGRVDYLLEDISVGGSNTYYWSMRDTCAFKYNDNEGLCGFWANQNEVYPDDFPSKFESALIANTYNPSAPQNIEHQLAGRNVLHHRMPTIEALNKRYHYDDGTALWNTGTSRLRLGYRNVHVPYGYQGVKFYYAKRTFSNSTVSATSTMLHGQPNWKALFSNAQLSRMTTICAGHNLFPNNVIATSYPENGYYTIHQSYLEELGFSSWGDPNDGASEPDAFIKQDYAFLVSPYVEAQVTSGVKSYLKTEQILTVKETNYRDYRENSTAMNVDYSNDLFFQDVSQENIDLYHTNMRLFVWEQANVTDNPLSSVVAVRGIEATRYLPPNIIDNDLNIDNRYGVLNCAVELQVPTFDRAHIYSSYYQTADYGDASWSNGYWVEGQSLGPDCVQFLPIVNLMQFKEDCYAGIGVQNLVTMTPTVNWIQPGGTGTVQSLYSTGDVYNSTIRHRVTGTVGINAVRLTGGDVGPLVNDLDEVQYAVTSDSYRGIVSNLYSITTMLPYRDENYDTYQKSLATWDYLIRPADADKDNDWTHDASYLRLNEFQQPLINDFITEREYKLPYRVARSSAYQPDSAYINLGSFPALDYLEQPKTHGSITNLQSFDDKLLIHHEKALYLTKGKETISTSETAAVVIGTGDIFQVPPIHIQSNEVNKGGTMHPLSCLRLEQGYFFVDYYSRSFMVFDGQQIRDLGGNAISNELFDKLDINPSFRWPQAPYPTFNNVAGEFPGFLTAYDPAWDRVILMITDRPSLIEDAIGNSYDVWLRTKETYSYSLKSNAWVSKHDYNHSLLFNNTRHLYGIENESFGSIPISIIARHVDKTGRNATIDITIPYGQTAIASEFNWNTKFVQASNGRVIPQATFASAQVYNDFQLSPETDLYQSDLSQDIVRGTVRYTEDTWHFNNFRDMIYRDDELTDAGIDNFIDSNGVINQDAVNLDKPYYAAKRFIHSHNTVRLNVENAVNGLLYLYNVSGSARASARSN